LEEGRREVGRSKERRKEIEKEGERKDDTI